MVDPQTDRPTVGGGGGGASLPLALPLVPSFRAAPRRRLTHVPSAAHAHARAPCNTACPGSFLRLLHPSMPVQERTFQYVFQQQQHK